CWSAPFWCELPSPGSAAELVVGIKVRAGGIARAWRPYVQVQTVYQNVGTARARIPRRQNDVTRKLALDVYIELLHASLLEVEVLRLQCTRKGRRARRRCDWDQ